MMAFADGRIESEQDRQDRLTRLTEWMRGVGVTSLKLADGTTIVLGPKPGPTKEVAPAAAFKPRRCACGHSLSRHSGTSCLDREGPGKPPCAGKCRLIEAGED